MKSAIFALQVEEETSSAEEQLDSNRLAALYNSVRGLIRLSALKLLVMRNG